LSLHASVVARDGAAVACVGSSGAGKSTIAARLCSQGWELLADDIASIDFDADGVAVAPTEAEHWLDRAALAWLDPRRRPRRGDKIPVAPIRVAKGPARLRGIVFLRFDSRRRCPK